MLDQFSERLQSTFQGFQGKKQLSEEDIETAIREIRRAFLEADVNLRVLKTFTSRLKERALGSDILKGLNPGQQLVGLVHEELIQLLGKDTHEINLSGTPSLVLLFGLQGSGKTTTAGKLALKLKKEQKNPLLVAADTFRPAAIDQLIQLGKQIQVPVHTVPGSTDMLDIAETGVAKAKQDGHDVVIIDTAGRLQVDTEMMAQLLMLERMLAPQEKLLVIDAMMGQEAVNVAEAFHEQLTMTGLIMTKLDGDARGGAVLSVAEVTGQPIKFVGMGEKLSALEVFHPERMASRILGMGDVLTLVEKAQQIADEEDAKRMQEKFRKQTFSLNDFMKIKKQLSMLGSFDQILGMLPIPGITKEMREMISHSGESQFKRIEVMIQSMTPQEREQPDLIQKSRIQRIAKGSGVTEQELEQFLQSFEQMRFLMKQFTGMADEAQAEDSDSGASAMRSGGMGGKGFGLPKKAGRKKKKGGFPGFPGMGGLGGMGGGGGFPGMGGLGGMGGGMPGGMPSLPPGMSMEDLNNLDPSKLDPNKLKQLQAMMKGKKGRFPF